VVVCLLFWIMLGLIPPQVMSFVYPVTDRYLFFPSVAMCLLLAWLLRAGAARWGGRGLAVGAAAATLLGLLWTAKTLEYLGEWRDPRSVWFAAATKSKDVTVFQSLGGVYQDAADQLEMHIKAGGTSRDQAVALADAVWAGDERRPALVEAMRSGSDPNALVLAFRDHLRRLAMQQFENAIVAKGTRVVPNLYFRLGKLAMDTGDLVKARAEFENTRREAAQHTSIAIRNELTMRSDHAIALTYWHERKYREAMPWLEQAEAEQTRAGGTWVPDIADQKAKLARLMAGSLSP